MKGLSVERQVRMLAGHPRDDQGHPTLQRDEAIGIVREHLELEAVEAYDTDDDLWRLWTEEAAATAPGDINATVLERVLERVKVGE